jgi:hypothetical protein
MKLYSYIMFVCYLLFVSCKKEELPVTAHDPGNVITSYVNMDPSYKWQFYYDLGTNTVVGQNLKTVWDLGFEATGNGYRVILNTAKAMYARNTGSTVFSGVTDTNGFTFNRKWDEPSGNLDSTAIGDWRTTNHVYIIDRGYNETGVHQGYRKIQFQQYNSTSYTVRFAELNGTGDTVFQIEKDSTYNFSFLSFSNGGQTLIVEPPKHTWDVCFSQYLHIFYNPVQPYLVTGCLLNRYNTFASVDSVKTFSEINFSQVSQYSFANPVNTIGYSWKIFTGGVYITLPYKNYIIRDSDNFYYKLHFIDFYDQFGNKGNPKWEFQEL